MSKSITEKDVQFDHYFFLGSLSFYSKNIEKMIVIHFENAREIRCLCQHLTTAQVLQLMHILLNGLPFLTKVFSDYFILQRNSPALTIRCANDVCLWVGLPQNPVTPWWNIDSYLQRRCYHSINMNVLYISFLQRKLPHMQKVQNEGYLHSCPPDISILNRRLILNLVFLVTRAAAVKVT